MKKIFKISLFALLFAVIMPFTMFLSGCGATPADEALGVRFDSQFYDDETGFAVFEVDLNVNTKLDFKVNPSSWGAYKVTYAIKECSPQNRSRFTLDNGKIKVENKLFEETKVEIYVNAHYDTCIVRLKQYPTSVFMYDVSGAEVKDKTVTVNASGSYTISPYGRFVDATGTSYVAPLLEYDYDFTVTSSDETTVDIPHKNRLKFSAIRKNVKPVTVTVKMHDAAGKTIHKLTVKVNVVLNAGSSMAIVDGYGLFVKDGSSININASALKPDADSNLIFGYKLFVISDDNRYIDDECIEVFCTTSESKYVTIENENARILIEPNPYSEYSFKVSLWTNLIKEDGSAYSISFNVKVIY